MQSSSGRVIYEFGPFRLDPSGRRLLRDGEPVGLTAKVLDVLLVLVEAQGEVVGRDALMDRVWPATTVIDANLTQTVSVLRKRLGDTAAEHRYIATVPGRGYQFTASVDVVQLPAEPDAGSANPEGRLEGAVRPEPHGRSRRSARGLSGSARGLSGSARGLSASARGLSASARGLSARTRTVALALPVLLVLLLTLAVVGDRVHRNERAGPDAPRSLAVLPFTVLTPDRLDPSFGVALSAAITNKLGDQGSFSVRSTQAVLAARRDHDAPLDIADAVGADLLLSGTVQEADGKVRVAGELLDVHREHPLWSVSFDQTMASLLVAEHQIAEKVAWELSLGLSGAGGTGARGASTASGEAVRQMLLGRVSLLDRTREGYEQAARHFEQAFDRDPEYVPALAHLAMTHALMASNGNARGSSRDLLIRAGAEARKAIERAPELAEAHIALGLVLMNGEYDWADAVDEFRRASALDPACMVSRYLLAMALMLAGDDDGAWREAQSFARPRPGLPPLAELNDRYSYGLLATFLGHVQEGRDALSRALGVAPDRGGVRMHLAIALDALGQHDEALAELDRAVLQYWSTSQATATLANYLGRSSDPADRARARQILADLETKEESAPGRTLSLAIAHTGAGSKAEAIRLLWKAQEEREVLPVFVQRDHRIDPLRSEPELDRLLEAMNLKPVERMAATSLPGRTTSREVKR